MKGNKPSNTIKLGWYIFFGYGSMLTWKYVNVDMRERERERERERVFEALSQIYLLPYFPFFITLFLIRL
jgi:hypothetical protein